MSRTFEAPLALLGECEDCCPGGGFECDDERFFAAFGSESGDPNYDLWADFDSDGDVDFADFNTYRLLCIVISTDCGLEVPREFTYTVDTLDEDCRDALPEGSGLPIEVSMSWTGGLTWESVTDGVELGLVVDNDNCRFSIDPFEYGVFNTTGACRAVDVDIVGSLNTSISFAECIEVGVFPEDCIDQDLTFTEDFSS